ncbi:MAG TPA: hypothetical protein VGK21_04650 [Candidatus Angelobacter sp.]|jgi:hypothetical protein
MKNIALYLAIGLFAIIALGAIRTILEAKFPFLRKWNDETRQAYLALTIAAAGLLAWAVLGEKLKDLRVDSVEIAGVKASVGQLEKRVDTLSDQMKAFFARKVVETLNEKNWNRVRLIRKFESGVILEVTLKQKPIPGSIEVFEGPLPMPEQQYKLSGRVLQFPANTEKSTEGLTIKYYPELNDSSTPFH